MPVRALASGKWPGQHPELMRRMVECMGAISPGLWFGWCNDIVEQAPALPAIREFPPRDSGESFEAVFVGVDAEDMRKRQTFPISKTLLLRSKTLAKKIFY